ncbi:MAG: carboxypeptidase M32, partial [Cetobacterium sp.]
MESNIQKFRSMIKEKKMIESMLAILQWDLETRTPKGGYKLLSELIGDLSLKSYNLTTSDEFLSIVSTLKESQCDLGDIIKKELEILEEEIEKTIVIPAEEYKVYSELTARAQGVWEKAREEDDFEQFSPVLEEIFNYNIKFIKYRKKDIDIYSQILNDYEKGMNIEKLDYFFENLKKEIIPLLKEVDSKRRDFGKKIAFNVQKDEQQKFSEEILKY